MSGEITKRFFLQKPFSRIVCVCAALELLVPFSFLFFYFSPNALWNSRNFWHFALAGLVATGIEYVFLVKSFVSEWNNIQRNHKMEPHKRGDKPKNHKAQA